MSGIAIVTGGGRGIGAATARLLARRGYDVAISYLSDAESAARAVDEELGVLTALVNNAGITGNFDRLDSVPPEIIRRCMDTNLYGTIWGCRAAVRRMSTRLGGKGGGIVNISSIASRLGSPNCYVWYAAAKGAVDSLTIGLAREVVREGIRVNAVSPGIVETDIHAISTGMPDRLEKEARNIPIGRAGKPEEIAEGVAWLLSDAASYVTAEIMQISGAR